MVFRKEKRRNTVNCPECNGDLVAIDVGPCVACGSRQIEILHFYSKRHTYSLYNIDGQEVILCNECFSEHATGVDLAGGSIRMRMGGQSRTMRLIRNVPNEELAISKDKFCPKCDQRLEYLEFATSLKSEAGRRKSSSIQPAED